MARHNKRYILKSVKELRRQHERALQEVVHEDAADRGGKKGKWLSNREKHYISRGGYFDAEGLLHNKNDCVQCTDTVKATGKRCKNFALQGKLLCKWHGERGITKAGNPKERIYSNFIQDSSLAEVYKRSMEDDTLQNVREEMSLMRGLLASCVKTLQEDDNITPKTLKDVAHVMGEIRQLMQACVSTDIKMGQLIDVGKIVVVVKQLCSIISKYIKDPDILQRISNEFDEITWPGSLSTTPQPDRDRPIRKVQAEASPVRKGNTGSEHVVEARGGVEVISP